MRRNTVVNISLTAAVAALVCLLDRLSKLAILGTFEQTYQTKPVIPGVLSWTYIRNRGAMMGILQDHRWVFMVLSVVLIALIILFIVFAKNISRPVVVTLAMILGGGIGNMIDRFAYGEVIDFIDVTFIPFWKWIFNVADVFVTVGAVLLTVLYIAGEIKRKKETENDGKNL